LDAAKKPVILHWLGQMFDPALTMRDLAWLREIWTGPLVVKGITTVEDARAVVDAGADALVVSNHGGRQLDRAPTPLEQLPAVVDAVGDRVPVAAAGGIFDVQEALPGPRLRRGARVEDDRRGAGADGAPEPLQRHL